MSRKCTVSSVQVLVGELTNAGMPETLITWHSDVIGAKNKRQ